VRLPEMTCAWHLPAVLTDHMVTCHGACPTRCMQSCIMLHLCVGVCFADRYNMDTGEWIEYTPMSNDKFKEQYGYVRP
jgi:hypothetical protein